MARNELTKLYPIRHNEGCNYNFAPGVSTKGEQVLMGVVPGHTVAIFFDQSGRFLRDEVRSISVAHALGSSQAAQVDLQEQAEWRLLATWKMEIGLLPMEIRITKFHLPKWDNWGAGLGLFDLPQFMQGCADDPFSEKDEQFRRQLLDDIEWFRSNGKYVLCWGTEYWMSKDGEVTDT
jgi:hypothetical protein